MSANFAPALPLSIALFAVLAAACAPDTEEQMFRDTGQPTFNSPEIDDAPFPELSLSGQPNSAGVTLVGLRDPGNVIHPLRTNGRDEIVVYDASETTILYRGANLVGWDLVLEKDGDELSGTITHYNGDAPAWSDEGRPLTTYVIKFEGDEPGNFKNVCPDVMGSPDAPVVTLIVGETYDRVLKKVDLIDGDWVTFACSGQAAYKAKALGYEQGEFFADTMAPATRAQQDATLKMITADFCGTGDSFTEENTPIRWENTAGTVTLPQPGEPGYVPTILEAVWNDERALCLSNPRRGDLGKVEAICPNLLPHCDDIDWATEPHEWVSYKPVQ
ncbi:ADYC domain-containing protein [Nannocystis punicea]|uniref:ADYC domain-containing protein n=1 Tax=Nannocystis punicea TaxID=2995304 RepID=A0ABY7H9F1_9BACT|nr:ADYC domain-containing protein [Nannocystis poenicansa]WAS95732.1 ADYC domain-containing protein [Nannocystis poenicansa]